MKYNFSNSANSKDSSSDYHPNPNNGNFSISQLVVDDKPVSAEIWNAVGMRMYKAKLQFKGKRAQVHLGSITAGNYLLKLTDNGGIVYTIKFTVLQ